MSKDDQVQEKASDPYSYMIDVDRWMIGRPADKACYDYVEAFQAKRLQHTRLVAFAFSLQLGPIGPVLILLADWVRRRLRNG